MNATVENDETSVETLLVAAKELIQHGDACHERGDEYHKQAAEKIAIAVQLGKTQREIAHAVGKSAGWVNRLLKWRKQGYREKTVFGEQSKESRQRRARVQATEHADEPNDLVAPVIENDGNF